MEWTEIARGIINFVILFAIIMFVVGVIGDAIANGYNKRMVEWLEGRVRDLEWERSNLQSDLRWVEIDLRHERSRSAHAEERNQRLSHELDTLYKMLAKREDDSGGTPAQAVAA